MKTIPIMIGMQGGVKVHEAYQLTEDEIIAIEVNLSSKYCEIDCTTETDSGCPVVYLSGGEHGLNLRKGLEKEATEIVFSSLKDYSFFCGGVSRYTLRVCFVKKS